MKRNHSVKIWIGLAGWLFGWLSMMHPGLLQAATLETPQGRIGIFGYTNALYTYMSSMAMQSGSMAMKMGDTSTFETDGNLLLQAEFMPIRAKVNLEYHNPVEIPGPTGDIQGSFSVLEAYGEYEWGPGLKLRAGHFLAPYGIYNAIRYVTPLFASVVLPMMYDPPMNYLMQGGGALVPDKANLMMFGDLPGRWGSYYLYLGNGALMGDGRDQNKDKAVGLRVRLRVPGGLLGSSLRRVNNDAPGISDPEGEETLWGFDLDLSRGSWNLQAEYTKDDASRHPHRYTYYARLSYQGLRMTPFVAYDFLKDLGDKLFKRGMHRYSAGLGYNVNPNLVVKAEYHYHRFAHTSGLGNAPEDTHMFRIASIFLF